MFRRMTKDRFLSDRELAAFMAAVASRRHKNQPRDHALFALLANTGIRPSEALALTLGDLHLAGREPWISVSRKKKRRPSSDELQIPADLAEILGRHAAERETDPSVRLFPFNGRQVRKLFHHYAGLAGIARGHRVYSLRHTAATRIFRATGDIRLVQALLGHERPDMSCIYAHITRAMLSQHARTFPVVVG